MIRSRGQVPEHLRERHRAFEALLPILDEARRALTESVPGTRLPGRPLADALSDFESGLHEVRGRMDACRSPEVEEAWRRAEDGLATALSLAERARIRAEEPVGFEGLIGLVGELLAPLDAFADVAERFRALRRSVRSRR